MVGRAHLLSFLVFAAACGTGQSNRQNAECANVDDGTECPTGLCCGGVCMDFKSDPNNCGACGLICPNQEECSNGACLTCAQLADGTSCQSAAFDAGAGLCCGGGCVDITSDFNNCAGCGQACSVDEACVASSCVAQCNGKADNTACTTPTSVSGSCCSQVCVDPTSDNNNCYNCGTVCGPGTTCQGAICQ